MSVRNAKKSQSLQHNINLLWSIDYMKSVTYSFNEFGSFVEVALTILYWGAGSVVSVLPILVECFGYSRRSYHQRPQTYNPST